MYRIAVVEDQTNDAQALKTLLDRYVLERETSLEYRFFSDAQSFLDAYSRQFDVIFMDIRMPGMNGMDAAHRLREIDRNVVLIFLTSLAQFAIQGYEVEALDFILKPITWPVLEMKLKKALTRTVHRGRVITLLDEGKEHYVNSTDLYYVEIYDHHIQYGTADGILRDYGTLKKVEENLGEKDFFRVNNQTIVNLQYVTALDDESVTVHGRMFPVSLRRRKEFVEAVHRFRMTGGNHDGNADE